MLASSEWYPSTLKRLFETEADSVTEELDGEVRKEICDLLKSGHGAAAIVKFCDSGLLGEILSENPDPAKALFFGPEDFEGSRGGADAA